jgi:hypothetical protein
LPTLKILLAEDVTMVRGALVALIELEPDFKVVASIRNGSDIVPTALACQMGAYQSPQGLRCRVHPQHNEAGIG